MSFSKESKCNFRSKSDINGFMEGVWMKVYRARMKAGRTAISKADKIRYVGRKNGNAKKKP